MTAESGETWWAYRSTSIPSMFGILISVMTTSNRADSSFLFAASPELTVSTLCPSRRKVISSISQIERSSSQIRMLGMSAFSHQLFRRGSLQLGCLCRRHVLDRCPAETNHECTSLPRLGPDPHLSLMRMNNLVHNGQAQSGPTFKLRLERFESFFRHLRTHTQPGVSEAELPVAPIFLNDHGQCAALLHGAHCIFTNIPEDLLHPVSVSQDPSLGGGVAPFDSDTRVLCLEAVLQQCKRVFQRANQIYVLEAVLLGARISQ